MKKFEWWDVIHEVGYVCGILGTYTSRKNIESVRDWCQWRLDHDMAEYKPEEIENLKKWNISPSVPPCLDCGGYHGLTNCPKPAVYGRDTPNEKA
jgi:hypothetical protein